MIVPQTKQEEFRGAFWDGIKGFFSAERIGTMLEFVNGIVPSLDKAGEWLGGQVSGWDDNLWNAIEDFLKDANMLSPGTSELFDTLKKYPPFFSTILALIMMQGQLQTYNETAAYAVSAKMRHGLNEQLKPELADVSSLIRTAMIAPEKINEVVATLYKWGYSDDAINTLFISSYRLYDENTCRELFLRGILSADKLFERMRELGFTDTRTKEMMEAWEVIPGPGDLFHMVAKEAFEPELIAHIGLGDEFPEEQTQWLEKQGISRFWAQKYWYAHWDQPSIQMGYEMLHRGAIDEKELDMLFKAVEMPPFWRDKLKKISYMPYTRVDIRRMFDLGIVDIDTVYANYQDLGYDAEHALEMTKFTIAYVDPEDKKLSKAEVLNAYMDKVLERSDCVSLLRNLGFKEDQVEFYIVGAEYDVVKKMESAKLKVIKDRYILRLSDKFETLRELSLLNLESARVDLLFEQWEIELFKDNKIPTKADLEKFWLKEVISEPTWYEEMDKKGYSLRYRAWYFELMEEKKAAIEEAAKPEIPEEPEEIIKFPSKTDLEKFWLNDIIDETKWRSQMEKLGYDKEYRDWYFGVMQAKKEGK